MVRRIFKTFLNDLTMELNHLEILVHSWDTTYNISKGHQNLRMSGSEAFLLSAYDKCDITATRVNIGAEEICIFASSPQ